MLIPLNFHTKNFGGGGVAITLVLTAQSKFEKLAKNAILSTQENVEEKNGRHQFTVKKPTLDFFFS